MKFMTLSAPSRLLAILFLLASLSACQTTKEFFGMDGTKKPRSLLKRLDL